MSCPTCGLRQWKYNENTLTCKNGHQVSIGRKPLRFDPWVVVPSTAGATLALDLLLRAVF